MAVDVRPLKPSNNETLLDAIRDDGSPDYQARIPEATKAGIQSTMKALQTFRPLQNEFLDALVNRIGLTIARNSNWTNPLSGFKSGMLMAGDTIEEIQVGLIKAKNFDPDRDEAAAELFGSHPSEVQANFHKINRQDRYPITINTAMLQRAFLDEGGLQTFATQLMGAPTTSDQWDEFLLTCQLFAEYESNGGFFKVKVPDVASSTSTEADAKTALRTMRAMAGKLKFISRRYNAAKMPVAAKPEELVIFCTPDFNAAIDVEALAGAFNEDRAKMYGRVIEIPEEEFGISGVQAIMTTTDFFVIADSLFENTSQWNPASLNNNYWLHHHQVISASRFAPTVLFTTQTGDTITMTSTPVTAVSAPIAVDRDGTTVTTVNRGEIYSLSSNVTTTPSGGDNDGVRWSVAGATTPKTYVTQSGVLHVGADEAAATLTVKATATWVDPDNIMKDGVSTTADLTVAGVGSSNWPTTGHITSITVKGVLVAGFVEGTLTYSVAVPGGTVVKSDVVVTGSAADHLNISVTGGNTVKIRADELPNDPVYTVNVTAAP